MRISAADILWFMRALPIARSAQAVRTEPLTDVIAKVGRRRSARGSVEIHQAVRAAQRACGKYARWFGGLDSCLTRSLVAGALLAEGHEVVLHVGFRPTLSGKGAADGHSWLVVDGSVVDLTRSAEMNGAPYESTLELPIG